MTNETTKDQPTKPASDRGAVAVFGGLGASALTAFAIQAWMTYGYADEVWGMPFALCLALVLALDLFAVMFMILIYQLRGAGWPRAVVTLFFFVAIGAQVAAAEMLGEHRRWPAEVRWFSILPAVFLAAAQEGVVLWRQHRSRASDQPRRERKNRQVRDEKSKPSESPSTPAVPQTKPTPAAPASVKKVPPSTPTPREPKPTTSKTLERAAYARRFKAGESAADLSREAGVTPTAIRLWARQLKETRAETAPEQAQRVQVRPVEAPSNGHPISLNGGATHEQ